MKTTFIIILLSFSFYFAECQTMQDTIFNYFTETPVVIDGQATEDCWANAEWHAIDQMWIPYGASLSADDFEGKFKVSWDTDYLYVLVEVVDDSLSDDHSDPLQNWWDDDCLEIFIDENRSMGDHERNTNAFAYHVSLFFDAIDLNSSGSGVNYKDNLDVDMDTIGTNTYLWELAIKMYSSTFNISNPEASRVYLHNGKLMGYTIAYCDNDETSARENFIGSMYMPQANANDSYKNANWFGPMLLKGGPNAVGLENTKLAVGFDIFPVPAQNYLRVNVNEKATSTTKVEIRNLSGQLVKSMNFAGSSINVDLEKFESGAYIISITDNSGVYSKIFLKE